VGMDRRDMPELEWIFTVSFSVRGIGEGLIVVVVADDVDVVGDFGDAGDQSRNYTVYSIHTYKYTEAHKQKPCVLRINTNTNTKLHYYYYY
jgi:hypothetical protein